MFKLSSSLEISTTSNYESGLYHFVERNYLKNSLMRSLSLTKKKISQREVWFISLPLAHMEPCIWPGYVCTGKHFSIDRYILDSKSPLDYFFTHAHATFSYEGQTQKGLPHCVTAHGYYNRHGVLVNINATEILGDGESQALAMNANLKAFIQENSVKSFSGLFVQLLEEKYKIYGELSQRFSIIEQELAVAQQEFAESNYEDMEQKEFAIAKIRELLEIIEERNTYDEFKSDKRHVPLARNLEYLESGQFDCIQAQDVTAKIGASINQLSNKKKKGKKPQKNVEPDKFDFDIYTAKNSEYLTLSESREILKNVKSNNVDSILRYLRHISFQADFSHNAESVVVFITKLHATLTKYFREKILCGDIEEVKFIYPFLSEINTEEMQESFKLFFGQALAQSDIFFEEKLVAIGDFFYTVSEDYRIAVFMKNAERHVPLDGIESHGKFSKQYSLLLMLFQRNKFSAFSMFLRHGVRPVSQYTECLYEGILLSLPTFMICDFSGNLNFKFLDILYEYQVFSQENSVPNEVYFSREEEGGDIKLHIAQLNEISDPFLLAIRRAKFCNQFSLQIIEYFSRKTAIKTIIFELPNLLNGTSYRFTIFPTCETSAIKIMRNREECELISQQLFFLQGDRPQNNVQVLCFPGDGKKNQIIECLLKKVAKNFPRLTLAEQREIIIFLANQSELFVNKAKRKELDPLIAQQLLIVAQWIDSMMTALSADDCAIRARLFLLRGDMRARVDDFLGKDHFYQQAVLIIKSLPLEHHNNNEELLRVSRVIVLWQEDSILK